MKKFNDNQQAEIDEGWQLYNLAMEACEELEGFLHDLQDEVNVDTTRASEAAGAAYSALRNAYDMGEPILPPHSNDLEDES